MEINKNSRREDTGRSKEKQWTMFRVFRNGKGGGEEEKITRKSDFSTPRVVFCCRELGFQKEGKEMWGYFRVSE